MFKDFDETLSFETNILEAGAYFRLSASNPEALPIHMSTAHNVEGAVAFFYSSYKKC